jgi:hypothetical protein
MNQIHNAALGDTMIILLAVSAVDHSLEICQVKPKTIKLVFAVSPLGI